MSRATHDRSEWSGLAPIEACMNCAQPAEMFLFKGEWHPGLCPRCLEWVAENILGANASTANPGQRRINFNPDR